MAHIPGPEIPVGGLRFGAGRLELGGLVADEIKKLAKGGALAKVPRLLLDRLMFPVLLYNEPVRKRLKTGTCYCGMRQASEWSAGNMNTMPKASGQPAILSHRPAYVIRI